MTTITTTTKTTTTIENKAKRENLCNKCPLQTDELVPHCYLPIKVTTIITTITTTTTIDNKKEGKPVQ